MAFGVNQMEALNVDREMAEYKDREFWVGKNRVHLHTDNIIEYTIVGEQTEETAIGLAKVSDKLRENIEGKINVLIDLNKLEKHSIKARHKAIDRFEDERLNKIALFGLHPVARVIASFIMGFSRKKEMRFFKNKADALAWLRYENKGGEPS
jgi:hypothetical protein